MTDLSELALEELCHTVRDILAKVAPLPMAHFRTALAVDAKADTSPVTIADFAAQAVVAMTLARASGMAPHLVG